MISFDQFKVNFETNEIIIMTKDISNQAVKVEPRIMQVFKILIENSPNVVTREYLIAEVWNNYGGADDALNQAISNLRKVLDDTDKDNRIINTVTKKGYQFNPQQETEITIENLTLKRKWITIIFITSGLLLSALYFLNRDSFAPPVASVTSEINQTSNENTAPEDEG